MINIQVDEAYQEPGLEELIALAARTALNLKGPGSEETDLSIVVTSDDEIQQLNHQFLENDSPTDVLSFPGGEIDPDTHRENLGDIIISFDRARTQALARQGTVESEIQLLVVHGVLHLLGFDHADDREKAEMWSLQHKALKALNLESINPS